MKNKMKLLKEFFEPLQYCRYLYFPLPKKVKKEHLDNIRERVSHYKPLIEQQTGINLGEVRVREYNKIIYDILPVLISEIKSIKESSKSKLEEIIAGGVLYSTLPFIFVLGQTIRMAREDFYVSMKAHKSKTSDTSTVYVGFGFFKKPLIFKRKIDESAWDNEVVHELSHILHSTINLDFEKSPVDWHEGFATYCEQEYFRKLYPLGYSIDKNNEGFYKRGKEKIEHVVKTFGIGALLEIPNRWREFESALNVAGETTA